MEMNIYLLLALFHINALWNISSYNLDMQNDKRHLEANCIHMTRGKLHSIH